MVESAVESWGKSFRDGFEAVFEAGLEVLLRDKEAQPLFHYSDGAGLVGILNSRQIWATHILHLNDATELELGLSTFRSVDQTLAKLAHVLEELRGTTGDYQPDVPRGPFVACFSTSPDVLGQWQAYCGGGGGFSLGLDLLRMPKDSDTFLFPVCYDKDRATELATEVLKALGKLESTPSRFQVDGIAMSLLPIFASAIKSSAFEAEQEWRLIRLLPPAQAWSAGESCDNTVLHRPSSDGITPYVAIDLWENSSPPPITKVIVGPGPHQRLQQRAVEAILWERTGELHTVEPSRVPLVIR